MFLKMRLNGKNSTNNIIFNSNMSIYIASRDYPEVSATIQDVSNFYFNRNHLVYKAFEQYRFNLDILSSLPIDTSSDFW